MFSVCRTDIIYAHIFNYLTASYDRFDSWNLYPYSSMQFDPTIFSRNGVDDPSVNQIASPEPFSTWLYSTV